MPNPFATLRPALELLAQEGRILPATGQAMEDLVRPDHEEVVDRLRAGEDYYDVILESPNTRPYVSLTSLHRKERHLLRYFLDGSARTYFIGDVVEGSRRSPVHIAQIGAAAVHRLDNGNVRAAHVEHRILLMLDKNAVSFGDKLQALVADLGDPFGFLDTMSEDGESERTAPGKEPRSRAAHKAHHEMTKLEDKIGRNLARGHDDWLVLDGSLSKDLYAWKSIDRFFGVTKSFSREPRFRLPGNRGSRSISIYELLADLPAAARTCVFSARAGAVGVWYVRLREQKHLDYPLMGVVKVEYPNHSTEALPTDIVDEISSALVAERQSTPHGKDTRWHAHLYSIYLAEQTVKNGFLSPEVLKAGLRWPRLAPQAQ